MPLDRPPSLPNLGCGWKPRYVKLSNFDFQKVRSIDNIFTMDIFWNSAMTGFFIFADESLDYFNFVDNRISHIDNVISPMFTWVGK
jgi:hypothetical protein